jgi:hypothetical protein
VPRLNALEDRTLPTIFPVTTLADNGPGSLRQAILDANVTPGDDTIPFRVTGTIQLAGALPSLSSNIDMQGPGASSLTVRRDSGGNYRIFTVTTGAVVSLSGLAIANGFVQDESAVVYGGGILNRGTLTIASATLADNVVQSGGFGGGIAVGGGVYNAPTGTLTVHNSTITRNVARIVNAVCGFGGCLVGAEGAGISNDGTATVSNSVLVQNVAIVFDEFDPDGVFEEGGEGGGITNGFEADATLTITASTISRNQGTGIFHWSGSMTITASTIAENQGAFAGGIANFSFSGDLLTIRNSTISGNRATNPFLGAGGIANLSTVHLLNSTVANNTGTGEAANQISNELGDEFRIRNTIIAGDGSRPNILDELTSLGHNLNSDGTGNLNGPGDRLNTDPRLGPLQDNGGPTWTHALLPGSPALDAGDNTDAPTTDQRGLGFARVANGAIDSGAFEAQLVRVEKVVLNDGSAQRSMVTRITVTFSGLVTLDAGAFELRRQDGRPVGLTVATSVVNGESVAVLTFTGADIVGGSLADGRYTLTIRADRVHDAFGRVLDGDGDAAPDGNRTATFFRRFGDGDGDGDVDLQDLVRFFGTWGRRAGQPGYRGYFDFDGDDDVDLQDLLAFLDRLRRG